MRTQSVKYEEKFRAKKCRQLYKKVYKIKIKNFLRENWHIKKNRYIIRKVILHNNKTYLKYVNYANFKRGTLTKF